MKQCGFSNLLKVTNSMLGEAWTLKLAIVRQALWQCTTALHYMYIHYLLQQDNCFYEEGSTYCNFKDISSISLKYWKMGSTLIQSMKEKVDRDQYCCDFQMLMPGLKSLLSFFSNIRLNKTVYKFCLWKGLWLVFKYLGFIKSPVILILMPSKHEEGLNLKMLSWSQ